ncbi:segregation/condensation protein A [Lactobacillaceae bacterium L1_55_11]|nr:segregation/condensation protein A [Lactobacillaceae bacterium L1_55_11]
MEKVSIVDAGLTIKITDFEGPLDLLLHLIKKNELDIFDLPIAKVTEQYLAFLHQQRDLALDIASDYLVMAASLIRLKSVDLLPQPQVEAEEDDYQDPRDELVNQLLVYQQIQAASQFFTEREDQDQQSFVRPVTIDQETAGTTQPAPGLQLVDLQLAFAAILARRRDQTPVTRRVVAEQFTIADGIAYLKQHLAEDREHTFTGLFTALPTRTKLVMVFLGLLELSKAGQVEIWQAHEDDDILIKAVKHG